MKTLILMLLPLAAQAQLVVSVLNGPGVGSTYSFGPVAINSTATVQLQVFNTGTTPVTVGPLAKGGAGFQFASQLLPYTIPANSNASDALNITVQFTPTSTASYSANLQISSLSIILVGSGVLAPTLTSGAGCSSGLPFNWGSLQPGASSPCTFTLANSNSQGVTVASIVVNGLGFTGPYGVTIPLTLQPGQSASFSVNFTPPGANVYSGTIVIGTQSFGLTGTGQQALLPTPLLQFDSASYASAQQGVLTVTIPGGSPVAATGFVNLVFAPTTAAVKDDSAIVFLANGSRTIPFSVSPGATTALLNGQNSATFQTGTTEGTITFTLTTAAAMTGSAPVKQLSIGGSKVIIDSTSASKERTGFLDITIIGADNTYSAGAMSFAFFDTSGNTIGGAASTDFTATFKAFYGGQTAGSAFRALVSFPVAGSVASIGSVTVTLTNAAGVASTGSLAFQ